MRQLGHIRTAILKVFLFMFLVPSLALGQTESGEESLEAQQADQSRIVFGLSAGRCLAAFWGPNATDLGFYQATEARRAYDLGVRTRYLMTQIWSVQTGLSYVQAGQKYRGISGGQRYSSEVQLSYLQVPVLVRADLSVAQIFGRPVSLHLSAGPQLAALLAAEEKLAGPSENQANDLGSITRSVSWGGQARIGFSTTAPLGEIGIEVQYSLGLRDVNTTSVDLKNQILTAALTFEASI